VKLPKLDDLIGEQREVHEHPADQDLFAAGPPGSGKTTLAVLRVHFLKEHGMSAVLLTRNRLLAAMARDLSGKALNATTMHTFVADDYWFRMRQPIPTRNGPYDYDWQQILEVYAAREIEPELEHLVIDEGQNLPRAFFSWAKRFGAKRMTVFADEDQSTECDRSSLRDIHDAGLPAPIRLTANHRNTPEIALVAEHFHRSAQLPPAVVRRTHSGERPELWSIDQWDQLVNRVAVRLANRNESIGVIVARIGSAKTVHEALRAAIPPAARVSIYTHDSLRKYDPEIRLLDPGVTVLTDQSAIGVEFDTLFLQALAHNLPCASTRHYRRMYMLCARAKNSLIFVDGPARLTPEQIAALPPPNLLSR
jgi:DNA helicase IV